MRGDIIRCPRYYFEDDGTRTPKFLIVLNEPSDQEPYLLVLTTSQQWKRISREGCHPQKGYYVLKRGVDWFDTEWTWIMFNQPDVIEILKSNYQDWMTKNEAVKMATLSSVNYKKLTDCLQNSPDVSHFVRGLVKKEQLLSKPQPDLC